MTALSSLTAIPLLSPTMAPSTLSGVATSYGVDVDTFTVNPYISPGQTSATTVFSAGGDLVLVDWRRS